MGCRVSREKPCAATLGKDFLLKRKKAAAWLPPSERKYAQQQSTPKPTVRPEKNKLLNG